MEIIIQNQIECAKCGDVIVSKHGHDFVWCGCGAVAVDGGMQYLRRVGNKEDYIEQSKMLPEETVKAMREAVEWAKDTGRNDLGIALAVYRVLDKYCYPNT